MIFDTHMHCEFSCDSSMKIPDAVAAADAENIGMTLTEHWDYDYPTNPESFTYDIDACFSAFAPYRSKSRLIGIEIGMQVQTTEADEKVATGHDFDFVLGSIHCAGHRDLYEKTSYAGRTRDEVIKEFLCDSILCVEQHDNFDAFAHIDYICRYWPYVGAERELRLEDNAELFDKLFKLLIEKNKPIEINTRRLDDEKAVQGLLLLYKRYQELGGKYCTLGSDAHYKEHVGRRMSEAIALARAVNLKPVYFRERKMQIMEGL